MPFRMQAGPLPMALLGYARVSTEDQATARQLDELRAAGCREVAEGHASGGARDRPVLARTLARLRPGDTLVVVSLDRLARSLSHLLGVVEGLQARGVHFRSLRDPVDTASPQGLFTLQVLGAAAQLERALIRERTRSGMRAAAARGRRAGNPPPPPPGAPQPPPPARGPPPPSARPRRPGMPPTSTGSSPGPTRGCRRSAG